MKLKNEHPGEIKHSRKPSCEKSDGNSKFYYAQYCLFKVFQGGVHVLRNKYELTICSEIRLIC